MGKKKDKEKNNFIKRASKKMLVLLLNKKIEKIGVKK